MEENLAELKKKRESLAGKIESQDRKASRRWLTSATLPSAKRCLGGISM